MRRSGKPRPAARRTTWRPVGEMISMPSARSSAQFTESYNKGDVKAISGMFTEDAEVTEESGQLRGREAVAAHFAATFAEAPKATIELTESLRSSGPTPRARLAAPLRFRPAAELPIWRGTRSFTCGSRAVAGCKIASTNIPTAL